MKQAHGNYVTGDNFWDRKDEIRLFIQRVDEGAHQLLVAQRRMGKTSLMREVARRLVDRYDCPFVDLQKSNGPADVIVELGLATRQHHTLWHRTKGFFADVSRIAIGSVEKIDIGELGVKLRAGLTAGNWSRKGDELLDILAGSDKPVLLLFDEVPILVNRLLKGDDSTITPERRKVTDEFMSWLRAATIRHKGTLRMVISGSIGLEPILRQARLSATLNTFVPFELKPWDEATAVGCLRALADEYGVCFKDNAEGEMVKRLGCGIPHYVQVFFGHVRTMCEYRGSMEFRADEVARVYDTDMLGVRGHMELRHYEDRLTLVLGREVSQLALEMLTEAAVSGCLTREALVGIGRGYAFDGRRIEDVQEEVLWVLEHDGYLTACARGYVFVSTLLRDWWKARHGFLYTAVLERGA